MKELFEITKISFVGSTSSITPLVDENTGAVIDSSDVFESNGPSVVAAGFLFVKHCEHRGLMINQEFVIKQLFTYAKCMGFNTGTQDMWMFVNTIDKASHDSSHPLYSLLMHGCVLRNAHKHLEKSHGITFKYHPTKTTLLYQDEPLTMALISDKYRKLNDIGFESLIQGIEKTDLADEFRKLDELKLLFSGKIDVVVSMGDIKFICPLNFNPFTNLSRISYEVRHGSPILNYPHGLIHPLDY